MSEHSDDACEVPLVERLRSVPSDARAEVEVGYCHHRYIPYGRLCHDAATKIRYFEAELAAANAEIDRLKAGGCARDQSTTQFCSEAVTLAEKLRAAQKERDDALALLGCYRMDKDELKARVSELQHWKAEQLAVEKEWDPNTLATLLGGQPGQSQRKVISEQVPKLLARIAELEAVASKYEDLYFSTRELLNVSTERAEKLESWIRGLDSPAYNPTNRRQWRGDIGWLRPGQCAYVGPEKPEGMR